MKKKKWIAPASCLVILALLLALYFILKNQNMEKEEETETAESVIGIGEEKATGIQFTVEGQQYSFIKEGDTWKKEDEVDFTVDQEKMSTLITTFTGLTADRTLTDISSLEEYGLDDPVNSVTLTGSDENQVTLHIGDKNKDTSDTYLYMNEDKSTVYVTGTDCEEALPDTLMDLAQSESFPSVTSTNITEVEVNNGGNIYTLTKDDSSNWQVSDNTGKGYSAEYQTVSTLNSTIAGMTFAGLADIQTEDLGRYGLEYPAAVIHVTYTEEVEAEKTEESESTDSSGGESDEGAQNETVIKELDIYVGAQDEEGNYYVRVGQSSQIHLMSESSFTGILDVKAEDFWSKSLGYTSVSQVNKMEITYQGETREIFRKTEETAATYTSGEEELNADKVNSFFSAFSNMAAQSKDLSLTAEGSPELTIEVYTDGGNHKVIFTPYNENFYLSVDTEGRPGLVNKNTVKNLIESYLAIFE